MPSPIPAGYHTVTPALVVNNCVQALEFYKQAFGAQELSRLIAPDGKIAHAEIKIGDVLMKTTEGQQLVLRRVARPEGEPARILEALKLTMPERLVNSDRIL